MKNSIINIRCRLFALLMIVINGVGAFASTPWTLNPSDYRYDMSLYLDVEFKDERMDYSLYTVGAFVGDECRGIAEILTVSNGSQCLYLRARSNKESGEKMTFKYWNKETDEIKDIEGVYFEFESNGLLGYPSDPYKIDIIRYYDVTLTAGDGGSVDSNGGHFEEGSQLEVTASPEDGYHFTSWSDGASENPRIISVNESISLYALFAPNSYKLTYVLDEEVYQESELDFGSDIIPAANPEKEGYTFSGWEMLPETMPAHDVTVKGSFTINYYRLAVYMNDELIYSENLAYGSEIVLEDPEVPEGMMFDGWISEIPEYMPAHDVEIYGSSSGVSGVLQIELDDNEEVTVYDSSGRILHHKAVWKNVRDVISEGMYIINGVKHLIK